MDAGDEGRLGLGLHILVGDGAAQLRQARDHAVVPVVPALAQLIQPGLEAQIAGIHQETQHMEGAAQEAAAQLGAHQQPHLHLRLHGQEPWNATQGVVVREAQGRQPGLLAKQRQSFRRVRAVRVEGMAVEVDQQGTRWMGSPRRRLRHGPERGPGAGQGPQLESSRYWTKFEALWASSTGSSMARRRNSFTSARERMLM